MMIAAMMQKESVNRAGALRASPAKQALKQIRRIIRLSEKVGKQTHRVVWALLQLEEMLVDTSD